MARINAAAAQASVAILRARLAGATNLAGRWMLDKGLGFRVWGFGLRVRLWGLGFGVWGLGFRV